MPDQKSKGATQGERIQNYCTILWGESEYGYDIPIETDDYINYCAYIRKDSGHSFGDVVMASGACSSAEKACDELERRLAIRYKHALSGKPMTREERLDYSGKKGKYRDLLASVHDEEDRLRGLEAEARRA